MFLSRSILNPQPIAKAPPIKTKGILKNTKKQSPLKQVEQISEKQTKKKQLPQRQQESDDISKYDFWGDEEGQTNREDQQATVEEQADIDIDIDIDELEDLDQLPQKDDSFIHEAVEDDEEQQMEEEEQEQQEMDEQEEDDNYQSTLNQKLKNQEPKQKKKKVKQETIEDLIAQVGDIDGELMREETNKEEEEIDEDEVLREQLRKKKEEKKLKKEARREQIDQELVLEMDLLADFERKWTQSKDYNQNRQAYKRGKFDDEEIEIVMKAFLDYATKKQLTEEEVMKLCTDTGKADFPKAWNEISKSLPNRSIQSIHNLVHRKFNPLNNQGSWTTEEETYLLALVAEHGRKWYTIGKLMHRTPLNVRDKFKQLGEDNNLVRDPNQWTLGIVIKFLTLVEQSNGIKIFLEDWEEQLVQTLGQNWPDIVIEVKIFKSRPGKRRSHVICEQDMKTLDAFASILDVDSIKVAQFNNIPWKRITKKIQTKSRDDLRNFWYQTLSLWFLQPFKVELKQNQENQLIEDIIKQNPQEDDEIDFGQVLPDSRLTQSQKKDTWHFIKKRIQIRKSMTVQQILMELRKQLENPPAEPITLNLSNLQDDNSRSRTHRFKNNLYHTLISKYKERLTEAQPQFQNME